MTTLTLFSISFVTVHPVKQSHPPFLSSSKLFPSPSELSKLVRLYRRDINPSSQHGVARG